MSITCKEDKMGCINSVPNVKDFSVINNKTFEEQHNPLSEDDFVNGIIYIKNMQWCMNTSKYVENLCFILASYQEEQLDKVKSIVLRLLSSKLVLTPAGKEFELLANQIHDVGEFYLACMHCIRKHAANNTTHVFNDVVKYIKTSVLFGYRSEC